jgi:uncharacterized protein YdiU (UPF0061 family)
MWMRSVSLADHVIARHYSEAANATNPYRAILDQVISRQAKVVAKWLLVGFIHGVMNTDNMSIAGETIDYGPCAFMDANHPRAVYSSIDQLGRYAYGNQPDIAQWNLIRLAEILLPLLAEDHAAAVKEAQQAIGEFGKLFDAAYAVRDVARFRNSLQVNLSSDGREFPHSANLVERGAQALIVG